MVLPERFIKHKPLFSEECLGTSIQLTGWSSYLLDSYFELSTYINALCILSKKMLSLGNMLGTTCAKECNLKMMHACTYIVGFLAIILQWLQSNNLNATTIHSSSTIVTSILILLAIQESDFY